MDGTGKICWLCDCKGWAFENRAKALIKLLPGYEHRIIIIDRFATDRVGKFDVIVCDFIPWLDTLKSVCRDKIVLGLRSFRALEIYEAMNV